MTSVVPKEDYLRELADNVQPSPTSEQRALVSELGPKYDQKFSMRHDVFHLLA